MIALENKTNLKTNVPKSEKRFKKEIVKIKTTHSTDTFLWNLDCKKGKTTQHVHYIANKLKWKDLF